MSTPVEGRGVVRPDRDRTAGCDTPRRLATETQSAFKPTEFAAYSFLDIGAL